MVVLHVTCMQIFHGNGFRNLKESPAVNCHGSSGKGRRLRTLSDVHDINVCSATPEEVGAAHPAGINETGWQHRPDTNGCMGGGVEADCYESLLIQNTCRVLTNEWIMEHHKITMYHELRGNKGMPLSPVLSTLCEL